MTDEWKINADKPTHILRSFKQLSIALDEGSHLQAIVHTSMHQIYLLLPTSLQKFLNPFIQQIKRRAAVAMDATGWMRSRAVFRWWTRHPLVSIIITCYNYGRYIEEAIDSVLKQTYIPIELLVVDDGSDDPETQRVLERQERKAVRMIHQTNQKLPAARNHGIHEAQGIYVCCLDADDILEPTYIEKCIRRLETGLWDICGCWQQNFGEDQSVLKPQPFGFEELLESNRMIYAAVFRKSLWERIGGYDERMIYGYEDWEFWIRSAKVGARAYVIPEPLFKYRKHGRSMIDGTMERHREIVGYIRDKHIKPEDAAGRSRVGFEEEQSIDKSRVNRG